MIKKILITFCFILFALTTRASLIVDTNNNSYIDSLTGIEWMDFGINNGQSFDYILSQLSAGGEYDNWRLPNTEEVYTMWTHVANLDVVEADYENPNRYGMGQLYANDLNNNPYIESVFDDVYRMMGYNDLTPYGGGQRFTSYGLFDGTDGLSYVEYKNYTLHPGVTDKLLLKDNVNHDSFKNYEKETFSTLLVRSNSNTVTPVPEPSSIIMFITALLGFMWLKLMSQNKGGIV